MIHVHPVLLFTCLVWIPSFLAMPLVVWVDERMFVRRLRDRVAQRRESRLRRKWQELAARHAAQQDRGHAA